MIWILDSAMARLEKSLCLIKWPLLAVFIPLFIMAASCVVVHEWIVKKVKHVYTR